MKWSQSPDWPRLADGVELVHGPGESVQLRGVHPPVRLSGRLAQRLLPLLDGTRPVETLWSELGEWPQEHVQHALELLHASGVLADGAQGQGEPEREEFHRFHEAFYRSLARGRSSGESVMKSLRQARVHVFGWGYLMDELSRALRCAGNRSSIVEEWLPPSGIQDLSSLDGYPRLRVPYPTPQQLEARIEACAGDSLVVLALPRPAPALLHTANGACLAKGICFFPIVLDRIEATLGPTVVPGQSACYQCFALRLQTNETYPDEEAAYASHLNQSPTAPILLPECPSFTAAVANLTVMEIIRLVTRFAPPVTVGHACFLEALSSSQRTARIWKLPRCPACSRVKPQDGRNQENEEAVDGHRCL